MKRRIAFYEFNLLGGRRAYLPLVSGQLAAYAFQDPIIQQTYEVWPFEFGHYPLSDILQRLPPALDVAAFSVSLWNEQLALAVAEEVKKRFPESLVVFGGCQIPLAAQPYLESHPFIDVASVAEGERSFRSILLERIGLGAYETIGGVTSRKGHGGHQEGPRDLDQYPSPYLTGWYEPLIEAHPNIEWQAIIETNRGCPFRCAFCWWSNEFNQKIRRFSRERIDAVLEWMAHHRIPYIFNADANFGMLPEDAGTVETLVRLKRQYGFPQKFRTCWGKNSNEKIYALVRQLHAADLDKGLTLARQTFSPVAAKEVHRDNIRLEDYQAFQRRAEADGVPTYTEIILGLPGETEVSWRAGLQEAMVGGPKHSLYVYHCEVLPGTPLYERQDLDIVRVPLQPIHLEQDGVQEYDRIVVGTPTMDRAAWRRCAVLSWAVQLFFSLRVGYVPLQDCSDRLAWVEGQLRAPWFAMAHVLWMIAAEKIQAGQGRAQRVPGCPGWWEQEEAAFLSLAALDWALLPSPAWSVGLPRLAPGEPLAAYAHRVVVRGRRSGAIWQGPPSVETRGAHEAI